jgi:nitric oxide reductase subunit B
MGMDFMAAQEAVEVHFAGLVLAASLFSLGIGMFVWNFIQYGLPSDEAVIGSGE